MSSFLQITSSREALRCSRRREPSILLLLINMLRWLRIRFFNNTQPSWQWAYVSWTRRQRSFFANVLLVMEDQWWQIHTFISRKLTDYLVTGSLPEMFLRSEGIRRHRFPPQPSSLKHAFWVKTTSRMCSKPPSLPLPIHEGTKRRSVQIPANRTHQRRDYQRGGWGLEVLETSAADKKGDSSGSW